VIPTDLGDPDSPLVVEALSRKCGMCKAEPGVNCRSIIDGKPLRGRLVHMFRAEMT
jgi:hypothetical protein